MLLWVNLHGAFIAGFVVLLLYGAGYLWEKLASRDFQRDISMERKFLFVSGSSLLVTLINPVGFRIWETSIGFLRNNYLVGHTMEYLSPDFQKTYALPFLILILLSILVISSMRRPFSKIDLLQISAWTGMGLISARNIPLYGLIAIPILADGVKNRIEEVPIGDVIIRFEERLKSVQEMIVGKCFPIIIIGLIAILFWRGAVLDFSGTGNQFNPKIFPVRAADVLLTKTLPDGNMFNYFPWGGYLLYRLWPEQLVFIDGQTDFYGEALTREYEQVLTQTGDWQMILQKYRVEWVIMPTDSSLIRTLSTSTQWKTFYQDSTATILIHEN